GGRRDEKESAIEPLDRDPHIRVAGVHVRDIAGRERVEAARAPVGERRANRGFGGPPRARRLLAATRDQRLLRADVEEPERGGAERHQHEHRENEGGARTRLAHGLTSASRALRSAKRKRAIRRRAPASRPASGRSAKTPSIASGGAFSWARPRVAGSNALSRSSSSSAVSGWRPLSPRR